MKLARIFPTRRAALLLALSAVILPPAAAHAAESAGSDELRLVVVVTRHGVRSPLMSNETLDQYSAQPWPKWPVAPGVQTAHGNEQMVLLGKYYRALYVSQGLLAGRTEDDRGRMYFRADNDQRTIATARMLAAGLIPGAEIEVVARPDGETDPLFRAAQVPIGHPDRALGVASVLGRIGGDPARIEEACRPALRALGQVLYGGDGTPPPGKTGFLGPATTVVPGRGDHVVEFAGTLKLAFDLTDALLLEYAEGLPMRDVGWGRMSPETLTQLLQLHSTKFTLIAGSLYPAQAQGSNLMDHILRTIDQAATGQAQEGAFGKLQDKMVVIVGHDTNILNLGGLLSLNWWLPGTQLNPILPGGALIFELRRHRADGRYFVRTLYVCPTLEQTRTLQVPTLEHPPASAPIFVPECSSSGPGFEAPLDRFDAVVRRLIDPAFVVPSTR